MTEPEQRGAAVGEAGSGTPWAIWDYGVGNLHSLRMALERAGARVEVTTNADRFTNAHVAVLPGVGAFGAVMDSLEAVRDGLRARHEAGRPILGVCIGHQVLYEGSAEDPEHTGLGLVPGRVERLPGSAPKIPHMGWNTLEDCAGLLAPCQDSYVYYVHSYAAPLKPSAPGASDRPAGSWQMLATTTYGAPFAAAIRAGETVGVQFHPEKSGETGARILSSLVERWGSRPGL